MMQTMPAAHTHRPHVKSLRQLLDGQPSGEACVPDVNIADITLDSRAVVANGAFIAVPGMRSHGLAFAEQALANGATVILYEPTDAVPVPQARENVTVLAMPNLSKALGTLADRFFDSPSAAMQIVGVTGTNGKTTSAYLLPAALAKLGRSSGYAGTLGYGHIDALQESAHTTADCITVHRQLGEMRDAGDSYVGMEVSSHALDQGRIDGVRLHSALFTNLTRDHLDYHGTLEAYGAAKERLFYRSDLAHCAINAGDAFGRELLARIMQHAHPLVTAYAATSEHRKFGDRQLFATDVKPTPAGMHVSFDGS